MALYTVSAQVALSTFQRPKPTCGIAWPVFNLMVAIFADVYTDVVVVEENRKLKVVWVGVWGGVEG